MYKNPPFFRIFSHLQTFLFFHLASNHLFSLHLPPTVHDTMAIYEELKEYVPVGGDITVRRSLSITASTTHNNL
jgi:hypothetical protein